MSEQPHSPEQITEALKTAVAESHRIFEALEGVPEQMKRLGNLAAIDALRLDELNGDERDIVLACVKMSALMIASRTAQKTIAGTN